MSIADEVRLVFSGFDFGPPCDAEEIDRAENELGHPLPALLRELYLSFDGFRGPTDAGFFSPLLRRDNLGSESLVSYTLWLRCEDYFPEVLQASVVFGNDGCGSDWGMRFDSGHEVFEWRAGQGESYLVVGKSPLDAWRRGKALYSDSIT
ncbi:SMI1/KNR4 family protein [Tundrisphaera sp. TA3]|uniref:SMI1/KNR4 family protein n=1 Tax=Tundrisphaera sp. TA3 TaxID=3435775 RepID=UPI003EBB9582